MIEVLAVVSSKNGRNSIVCSSVHEAESVCEAMATVDRHATVAIRIPMPHGASVVLDATTLMSLSKFLDDNKIEINNVARELRGFPAPKTTPRDRTSFDD